ITGNHDTTGKFNNEQRPNLPPHLPLSSVLYRPTPFVAMFPQDTCADDIDGLLDLRWALQNTCGEDTGFEEG
ncbi:hypothetical protein HK102_010391, partial [Quaeritorhiza haematococci]